MIPPEDLADVMESARRGTEVRRGGNSTVTRALWKGRPVAVKDFTGRADARARVGREWNGLTRMWSAGLRLAPEPLAVDPRGGICVQEWLEGVTGSMDDPTESFMVECLSSLHRLAREAPGRRSAEQRAADAIDGVGDLRDQVLARADALRAFGHQRARAAVERAVATADWLGPPAELAVAGPVMTLSPSDFGPHNIIVDATTGSRRMIDLEFFGWDDAHKLACDTLLHPLVDWAGRDAPAFLANLDSVYGLDEDRLCLLMPWISLKWSLIALARADRELLADRDEQASIALKVADRFRARAVVCESGRRDCVGLTAVLSWES